MREVSLRMAGYLSDQAAKGHAPRAVRCIHCAETMHVSTRAETATCPRCYKRQTVQDVIVDTEKMGARVETTGILFIKKKGRVWAPGVKAGEAVDVEPALRARGNARRGRVLPVGLLQRRLEGAQVIGIHAWSPSCWILAARAEALMHWPPRSRR